jgi:hypothetical protein
MTPALSSVPDSLPPATQSLAIRPAHVLSTAGESPGSGDDQSPAWRPAYVRPDRTDKENDMALDNKQIVRKAYQIAEDEDLAGCVVAQLALQGTHQAVT